MLLLKEEVSSLDREFKNPLSDASALFSRAPRPFASEGAGESNCTAHVTDFPISSVADELLTMSIQDCLSLDMEEDRLLGVFFMFSMEEKERDVSLNLGEDEDACCAGNRIDDAGYVWLPIRFDGEMAYLDWHDEWRIENYE